MFFYALDFGGHNPGSTTETGWTPDGLPVFVYAAACHVFESRKARARWIDEDTPNRITGRYSREECDSATGYRQMLHDLKPLMEQDEYEDLSVAGAAEIVEAYAAKFPERMHRSDSNATGLARLRIDAGYDSRRALSEKCGVSVQRLYDWETRFRDPTGMSLDTAHRLADALGVTIDALWAAVSVTE